MVDLELIVESNNEIIEIIQIRKQHQNIQERDLQGGEREKFPLQYVELQCYCQGRRGRHNLLENSTFQCHNYDFEKYSIDFQFEC